MEFQCLIFEIAFLKMTSRLTIQKQSKFSILVHALKYDYSV